ncbi:MAG: hypothetical protein MI922_18060, partial [Bacteroidales bacterium]|nr:hypothetical protein [Bacteroidales bacterium]
AVKDLRKIYNFNTELIGEDEAFELVLRILAKVDFLTDKKFVKMGATDEELKHLKRQYKKLIEGYIKVTYRISTQKPMVYINRVFDTRQHPAKNK